jgi:endonuclease YncB( thermonuclease family)
MYNIYKILKGNVLNNVMGNCVTIAPDQRLFNQLAKVSPKDVSLFSLKGNRYPCRIVSVYDGDTCTALFKLDKNFVKFKVRMLGYDSPEMKPRLNIPDRDKIKEDAIKAREALVEKTKNKKIILHCGDWDKYGRLLGTLYEGNLNINEWMIESEYGYRYDGGRKRKVNEV